MLPSVENLNRTRRARNGSMLYEPISVLDIAFDEFPKLSDVLPNVIQNTSLDYDNIPGFMVKNISIDMEKINMKKLRKKMEAIAGRFSKDEAIVNTSRRQAIINTTERLGIKHYFKGNLHMVRRKILDCMLQVLYMARHKIHKLENAKHFSTTDTGFRIAYTYRMLTRMYRKMMRIFTHQIIYLSKYGNPNRQIIAHGKVTRLHVDFCYLYWVLVKVDGAYKNAKGIRHEKKKVVKMLEEQMQAQKDAQSALKELGKESELQDKLKSQPVHNP